MQPEDSAGGYNLMIHLTSSGDAEVYLGRKENQLFILKIFIPGFEQNFAREVQNQQVLHHPHILRMVESQVGAQVVLLGAPPRLQSFIAYEYTQQGELFKFVKAGKLPLNICRFYIKQLISAVRYFTQNGYCHRDIKLEHILLNGEFSLKLVGFSSCCLAQGPNHDCILTESIGAEGYRPLEVNNHLPYRGVDFDIFSVGVVLFILCTGKFPFLSAKQQDKCYRLIINGHYERFFELHQKGQAEPFPESLKRLFISFFSVNPAHRPTFQSLQEDEWMNGEDLHPGQVAAFMTGLAAQIHLNEH